MKKKAYFGIILVPEGVTVKESGAAIVFVDSKGAEHTEQVPLFQVAGTSDEITEQITAGVGTALGLIDERLNAEKAEDTKLILPY